MGEQRGQLQRILYVEDDADIRAVAELALATVGGFSLKSCSSGQEALLEGPDFAPELILLDVMMPGMDGPSTFHAMQADPVLKGVPVVFMTAKVQTEEVASYRELGAVEVIPKPFDPMTLADQICEIWKSKV
ncbi:response regulator [Marinobacter sp. ATCH36]|uniref:response regulator n=1 Tax=Marinobacter sp. ATCH36 TaxID=2945106 RepID=UPI00202070BC|nr:response regulator [Marinobacter sp. ATCH36]MCL7943014.1 response regulator [Marinobacter sp. ATCH36]